ncbi:hypothetical protein GRI62_11580 [Erythrobacter arachoides]|uniref:HNH domain-containing protein n=1 Tax=Aurantiacibacter arachoides TaxID=1850444 RepID=A0A845A503_9SPHN|nr:HNH endonuclease [Aurantiacibacter arachoides]MXO94236.1 hypothetical protein [Aurantiacibacter arachoides]
MALGIEAFPAHFSAGWSQPSFELLQAAGYQIIDKYTVLPSDLEETAATAQLPNEYDDRRWAEGNPKRVVHLRRERSPVAMKEKKAAVLAATGTLACEHCGFEPGKLHGPAFFDAGLDVHHTIPLSQVSHCHETTLDDLKVLCATCHRIEHRKIALAK